MPRLKIRPDALVTVLVAVLALAAAPARADTFYVSDMLTVALRAGPSDETPVIYRGLAIGARITLLERDAISGFVRVRTDAGLEGWLPADHLAGEPPARGQLAAANREVARLNGVVAELRQELERRAGDADANSVTPVHESLERLREDVAELRRVSTVSLETESVNHRLTELNAQLRQEIETLALELQDLRARSAQRWLLSGAGLVVFGFLLGLLVRGRSRRGAWG
jgi:SH3 domain protein